MDGMDIDLDELRANLSKYKGTVYILGLVSSDEPKLEFSGSSRADL